MKSSLASAVVFLAVTAGIVMAEAMPIVYEIPVPPKPVTQLDRIVLSKLSMMTVSPRLCSDGVFVRRAYLDILGIIPTAKEAREFIESTDKNKRQVLIDNLLKRDEFADYWAMKWSDVFRIKAEFPVNLWPNAAQAYHRWVRASITENKPYDQFVRELLTSSGSNFRVGPVNFYRAVQNRMPEGLASAVALAFMGSRTDTWKKDQLANMAVFFSQVGYKPTREWKEEVVFWDPLRTAPPTSAASTRPTTLPIVTGPITAIFPDGTKVQIPPDKDPREVFADWLINPKNKWFARAIVNRVWSWLLGRGIIHEPDDIRDDNPPCNPGLLAYLEKELIDSKYDLKHLYRVILNSQVYQFSSIARQKIPVAEANFASYPLRRMEAEVLIDAINKITGTTDLYTSAIPEPFTYIPQDKPAVAIADGSITSAFLTLFGRSARATGMENERSNKIMPSQWLHMLNSSHIQNKLEQSQKLRAICDPSRKQEDILIELYLTILSRFPTVDEVRLAEQYGQPAAAATAGKAGKGGKRPGGGPAKRREDWIDLAWAMINSSEFMYRH